MNPIAGIGGPAALKGSDGFDTVVKARQAGSESKVIERTRLVLQELDGLQGRLEFIVYPGVMGQIAFNDSSQSFRVVGPALNDETAADDTRRAVEQLQDESIDILLFAGGDGTARDVCDVIKPGQVVLGIPCGVKMHSGVFANSPLSAGKIIRDITLGNLTSVTDAEVRDIDEEAFRQGVVRAKYYGEMTIPEELRYIQQTKSGGVEVEDLVLQEIAADVVQAMLPDPDTVVLGSHTVTVNICAP